MPPKTKLEILLLNVCSKPISFQKTYSGCQIFCKHFKTKISITLGIGQKSKIPDHKIEHNNTLQ